MKRILSLVLFLLVNIVLFGQNSGNEAVQIKQQMAAIRKSTNWSDPEAARAANKQIEELSAKLTQAIRKNNAINKPPPGEPESQADEDTKKEVQEEMDDYNNKLWNQMMKITREGGTWDFAGPLRDEIVQEYKDDEDPTVKNAKWLNTVPYLLINMSMPNAQVIIDQMPAFRGVKTLIITCEEKGTQVDLGNILKNASAYPLEELHILNFGSSVTDLPPSIADFSGLTTLYLFNNDLRQLPAFISQIKNLTVLSVDMNPLTQLLDVVKPLHRLKQLGVAKTSLSEDEIRQIQQALPNCEILK
jgi:hypothetical protein